MGGTCPTSMSERPITHIIPWEEHIQHPCQKGSLSTYIHQHGRTHLLPFGKGSALTFDHGRNTSNIHVRRALHLHLTMGGTNPTTMSEMLTDSSLPLGRNLDLENTKLLPKVLKLHSSQWLGQHISYHHRPLQHTGASLLLSTPYP